MANPKATRLPSGNYRCVVRLSGLPARSFTGPNRREVEREALRYKATAGDGARPGSRMTVGEAYDAYIRICEGALAPSTISGYRRLRRNTFQSLMKIRLDKQTEDDVQKAVNAMSAAGAAPKYVRNAHGLLSAVVKRYGHGLTFASKLPQKKRVRYHIPSEAEIARLQQTVRGTKAELPVLLGCSCGLRISEVRGLQWEDIQGDRLHIVRVVVDVDGGPKEKPVPKSENGDRYVTLSPRLQELLRERGPAGEKIVPESSATIRRRFQAALEAAGLPHYKFHELRHSYASVMLAIGIPNKYAAHMIGHKSTDMLDKVYQQLMEEYKEEYGRRISDYYAGLRGPAGGGTS